MARHYSVREFFRQMPNALLARFFHQQKLFETLDFSAMKETKPDELFEAWLALPDKVRNGIDTVFQEIFEMSCEKGFMAIIDEIHWQLQGMADKRTDLTQSLSALPNHYYRSMNTYLDYAEFWKGATRFYHADTLSNWRKRKNMGHNPAAVDKASIGLFADLIRNHFHQTEGRGNNCIVEVFRRGDLDYFFAYPEDYSQQNIEWVDGEFARRPHNPAFEIVYIYSQKDGTLDLNFQGSYKAIESLQGMFAKAILNMNELPPDPKDSRVYDLNPLRNRNFGFTYALGSGIDNVAVKKIRFSSRIRGGERITLEADVSQNQFALHDQIEKVSKSVSLNLYNVTQVELTVTVSIDINKPPKNATIRLTYPNSCSLKYDGVGLMLRKMLESSGIEPKEPILESEEILEPVEA